MATKGKRPMRALTAGDKIEAIQRVNDGESKASVARDIGVPESTLRGWCKNEDKLRYMSSRHSTPDADKLSEEPHEKRARYNISPTHINIMPSQTSMSPIVTSPCDSNIEPSTIDVEHGLDLSNGDRNLPPLSPNERPLELTTDSSRIPIDLAKAKTDLSRFNTDLMNNCIPKNEKLKPDYGANVSMSAISPLTGLNPLNGITGLTPGSLGMSFNDIATNLSLIAQLNPSLSALTNSITSSAKALRSIRSPKPNQVPMQQGGILNLSEKQRNGKTQPDYYDRQRNKPPLKEPPVDDALWYWLKTQQAMLDLTSPGGHLPNPLLQGTQRSTSPKDTLRNNSPKPTTPVTPLNTQMDKNTWLWQYYKQIGGALPLPEEKMRNALQVPRDNILYSHLTKGIEKPIESKVENNKSSPQPYDVDVETDVTVERNENKNHAKARTVLDNLLYNNNMPQNTKIIDETFSNMENEVDSDTLIALEHGEKFLCWLETCRDPSVTQMRVHQLRSLIDNIKTSTFHRQQQTQHRISRRK